MRKYLTILILSSCSHIKNITISVHEEKTKCYSVIHCCADWKPVSFTLCDSCGCDAEARPFEDSLLITEK